jgi:hypothetical protein
MSQNLLSVALGMVIPSWGRSRSRNRVIKSLRQRKLASVSGARNEGGSPPRSKRSLQTESPVSSRSKPSISRSATRPARDSEIARTRTGDALPRRRKRDFLLG